MNQAEPPTVSDGAHPPFKALVRELITRLPSATSSQLGLVRELEVAVVGRRTELESSCAVPVVVAQRPVVGETHPRDEPPPPPLPQTVHPRVPRPPLPPRGTVTHVAGDHSEEEVAFRDGPALAIQFNEIGCIVAVGGVLYMSDLDNYRIRKLCNGVVSTLAGTGERGFRGGGGSEFAQFAFCSGVALDIQEGRLLVADFRNHQIRAVTMDGTTSSLRNKRPGLSGRPPLARAWR